MLAGDATSERVDALELLLITHPGEFDLVGSDRNAFLIVLGRARGHDYDGQVGGSGRSEARDSANLRAKRTISGIEDGHDPGGVSIEKDKPVGWQNRPSRGVLEMFVPSPVRS